MDDILPLQDEGEHRLQPATEHWRHAGARHPFQVIFILWGQSQVYLVSTRFEGFCMVGDQDWVTLLTWKMPAFFFKLPCAFNYIIGLTMVNNSFLFFWEGWWKKVWSSDQPFRCSDLSLQEDRKKVDLGSEADCKSPKIIHRTTSLDNSISHSTWTCLGGSCSRSRKEIKI